MNKDPIENLYKDAFARLKPISTEDVLRQIRQVETRPKPARIRKKTLIVLIAACFLLFSTAAVAAAQAIANRSGIERLAEVIGEEEAAKLQHLGLTNIPEETDCAYDYIPNIVIVDPDANISGEYSEDGIIPNIWIVMPDEIYHVDTMITDDGIRIELIAVGAGYDYIDMYLLLEDLVGNRFVHEEWFTVNHYLRFTDVDFWDVGAWGRGFPVRRQEVIDRDVDAGIVLLHSRLTRPRVHTGNTSINPRHLTFNLTDIHHNFYFDEDYTQVSVDLAALLSDLSEPSPIWHIGRSGTSYLGVSVHLTNVTDIMQPHSIDYSFDVRGFPMYISAIGVLDGKLHIQTFTPGSHNFNIAYLQRPCGERISAYGFISFKLDEEGRLARTSDVVDGNTVWLGRPQYNESIFAVDADNLEGYSLIGFLRVSDSIALNWVVSFELVGGLDAAAPVIPPQLMQMPNRPSMRDLRADPVIKEMIGPGYGYIIGIMLSYPDWLPVHHFIDVNGVKTKEEDFHTLPPLLVDYIWHSIFQQEIIGRGQSGP